MSCIRVLLPLPPLPTFDGHFCLVGTAVDDAGEFLVGLCHGIL